MAHIARFGGCWLGGVENAEPENAGPENEGPRRIWKMKDHDIRGTI